MTRSIAGLIGRRWRTADWTSWPTFFQGRPDPGTCAAAFGDSASGCDLIPHCGRGDPQLRQAREVRVGNAHAQSAVKRGGGVAQAFEGSLARLGQRQHVHAAVVGDVARAALFLASDAAGWITGVILDVAGGATMVR